MFKQLGIGVFTVMFLVCAAGVSFAGYKSIKAIGVVQAKPGLLSQKPTTQQKMDALENSKRSALDKYIAGLDSQRIRILNNLKDAMYRNINVYVPEVVPLNDGNLANGYWNIDVEASINEAQIEELINSYTQANIAKEGEKYISFVFVAREVDSVKEFIDEKTEKLKENNDYKENVGANENINGAGASKAGINVEVNKDQDKKNKIGITNKGTSESASYKEGVASEYKGNATTQYEGNISNSKSNAYEKTSGGSIEKKSEVLKYRGYSPEEIEAKVTEVFNKSDFTVVPSFETGIDKDKFAKDFSSGNDIKDATKKEAVDSLKSKEINLFVVAMLDVGREQVDPATGLSKVYVNVIGYILDSSGKFTKKIASVGPVQYSGLGENPKVAKVNALINAGTSAAKDLVDQLRAKKGL